MRRRAGGTTLVLSLERRKTMARKTWVDELAGGEQHQEELLQDGKQHAGVDTLGGEEQGPDTLGGEEHGPDTLGGGEQHGPETFSTP
jgi:hypothetical protein